MSEPARYLDGRVAVHAGDCLAVVKTLADNCIDAVVTDPPYALVSIGKRFGGEGAAPPRAGAYARAAAGFMGKRWDTGETAFAVEFWAEIWRVLKPGGHVVAFGGTRSFHRLACAIEDARFEIRDQLAWAYATGFPKSHDVSKGIDKAVGCERAKVRVDAARLKNPPNLVGGVDSEGDRPWRVKAVEKGYHEAVSDEAVGFQGWGTALKPAWEPICLARKPLSEGTVAANVLRWGTGAINVGACRIEGADAAGGTYEVKRLKPGATLAKTGGNWRPEGDGEIYRGQTPPGRWPANIVHDGSDEVIAAFPSEPEGDGKPRPFRRQVDYAGLAGNEGAFAKKAEGGPTWISRSDGGSAARFFFSAKADADDRLGSKHPTVKPVDLMRWLCRLITPPRGTILDPFAGTGTTGEAAWREGFDAVLIEREAEYGADIARRMALAEAGRATRKAEGAKARAAGKPLDPGPLFGALAELAGADRLPGLKR